MTFFLIKRLNELSCLNQTGYTLEINILGHLFRKKRDFISKYEYIIHTYSFWNIGTLFIRSYKLYYVNHFWPIVKKCNLF